MHEIYGSSKFELEAIESKAHWIGERVNPRNILVIELHFRWMLFESIELDILFSLRASFFERKRIYITKLVWRIFSPSMSPAPPGQKRVA